MHLFPPSPAGALGEFGFPGGGQIPKMFLEKECFIPGTNDNHRQRETLREREVSSTFSSFHNGGKHDSLREPSLSLRPPRWVQVLQPEMQNRRVGSEHGTDPTSLGSSNGKREDACGPSHGGAGLTRRFVALFCSLIQSRRWGFEELECPQAPRGSTELRRWTWRMSRLTLDTDPREVIPKRGSDRAGWAPGSASCQGHALRRDLGTAWLPGPVRGRDAVTHGTCQLKLQAHGGAHSS